MDQSKIENLRRAYSGPMTDDEKVILKDIQAFISFCIENGLSFRLAIGTIAHDVNGLSRGDDVMPKTAGYAKVMAELPQQLDDLAVAHNDANQSDR